MITRTASCSCGQLSATVTGEPVRVSVCHCLNCKRRSGSAFAAQARFASDQAVLAGTATEYVITGDEGSHGRFRFCPTCGATVYYTVDEMPGWVIVPMGAFADPDFPPPTISVYESRMHSWLGLPADIEHN